MASTTNAKKEIIDFLWEWADPKGNWAKLLVDNIVKTESVLTAADRQIIFDYFIDSLRTIKKLPAINIIKPTFTVTNKDIKLTSISDITGVNKLAKNQKVLFADNLTIIYGENGTGKTGYGRILRSLGFSYEQQTTIHHNIFTQTEPKSATIDFKVNGVTKSFTWSGSNTDDALSNISVFNNNCVQISLSNRKLIVSPIGFHLFDIVTSELAELSALLNLKKSAFPETLLCSAALHEGTPQHKFIKELSDKSTDLKLKELSVYPTNITEAIAQKEKDLAGLNQELLNTQISNLNSQITELEILVAKIKTTQLNFNQTEWDALIKINEDILTLQGKTKLGLKEIALTNGILLYESEQFKDFLTSADNYINLLEQPYPNEGDKCAYCNQPLEETAQKLLLAYRTLLNDTTESDLKKLLQSRVDKIDRVKLLDDNYNLNQPSFGLDNAGKNIIPSELTEFYKKLSGFKKHITNGTIAKELKFDIDYKGIIDVLEKKNKALSADLTSKNESLLTITDKVLSIRKEISELKDRKLLAENETDIKKVIQNKKNLKLLNSKATDFSSNSISRKTSEAREELISQNFDNIFQDELKAFRKSHLKIDLSFGTDKGNSKISQKINKYQLTDILSEGEQKAIALAEFLTELQLDNSKAPVVFDDPVNSLDHNIIDDVSKRLIKLSKDRQVIIFTHSVLLFNSLLYTAKQPLFKSLGCKFLNTKNEFHETGFISEAEEINTTSSVVKKIEVLLNNAPKGRTESDIAGEAYGHLRSAVELCVEHEVFQGTVKRYQKNVALTSFAKVDGQSINNHKEKLNEIFERCCGFLVGHSNPTEIDNSPTMIGLKADFTEFKEIRKVFNP